MHVLLTSHLFLYNYDAKPLGVRNLEITSELPHI